LFSVSFLHAQNTTDMYYKISKRFYINHLVSLIFLIILFVQAKAQDSNYTRPVVTGKYDDYKKQVAKDSSKKMVELKSMIPGIAYDLRYASTNNFMRRLMYPACTNSTFLRMPSAAALLNVQKELNESGWGLKIYDAYRPYSVTVKFWELVKDERYVANPSKGSGHNRGTTVDLTIINLKTGKELNMGTDFDNFSDTAHHSFTQLPEEVLQNRILLKSTMEKYEFKAYNEEWWHYSLAGAGRFELLDIEFRKLKRD
jgi:zinc D-Ala-D-Ala dipeptidase